MTCPKCYAEFESGARSCPECGLHLIHSVSGDVKTSSVMIAAGEEQSFYRSVQEVPEPLRSRLLESTQGANSGTIVIADRAGKEQITQVIARRANARERKAGRATNRKQRQDSGDGNEPEENDSEEAAPERHWHWFLEGSVLGFRVAAWVGLVLLMAALALIALVFRIH